MAKKKKGEDTRRPKGEGAFFRRENGLYVGRVELPSLDEERRYRTVSSMDKNVAIRKFNKLKTDVLEGRITATGNTTVSKWLDKWVNDIAKLRPGTKDDYVRTIRLHINPHIGRKRLSALEPDHIRELHEAIPYTRTAQVAHVILQGALKAAKHEGVIPRNVAEIVGVPDHTPEVREPLTVEQAKQLLRSAIELEDPMATKWAAAFLLGPRPGELLGLQTRANGLDPTRPRLDLENGIADFSWQLQHLTQGHGCGDQLPDKTYPCGRKRVGYCPKRHWKDLPRGFEHEVLHRSLCLTRPKTKAGIRIVPIPLPLWYMLEKHPRGENPHDLVWHTPDGRPIHPRDDHHNWTAALKAAGLPHAPPYVSRHTTATLLLQAGVPEDIRMAILGHVSITAHRGYAHVDQTMTRQAMTALDQLLA